MTRPFTAGVRAAVRNREPNSGLRGQQSVSISETALIPGEVTAALAVQSVDFDTFYEPARESVIRALTATLGSSELAVEATDEALARAVQRWGRVGTHDNPAGWVYRVGLNYARNRKRAVNLRLRRPIGDGLEAVVAAPDSSVADPAIRDALLSLSLDQRAVVVCRLWLGWSEHQTAEALSLRPGTVKSRLSRALSKLERRLEHLRPEES